MNSESLKSLNSYADQISQGHRPPAVQLEFYVREDPTFSTSSSSSSSNGTSFARIEASLSNRGSLAPLFLAFGLITVDQTEQIEAAQHAAFSGAAAANGGDGDHYYDDDDGSTMNDGRDLYEWLNDIVSDAVATADQHESMRLTVRDFKMELERTYSLAGVFLGGEHSISAAEQRRHLEALITFAHYLENLEQIKDQLRNSGKNGNNNGSSAEGPSSSSSSSSEDLLLNMSLEGLHIRLYHPEACPMDTIGYMDDDGALNLRSCLMKSRVGDDGTLHIVANAGTVAEEVATLDLHRARLLTRLSGFWLRRQADLAVCLKQALRVDNVWSDSKMADGAQKFVLWAGAVLSEREAFDFALAGRQFSFSVLVHGDENIPMIDFLSSSSVLQIRSDCPPTRLLDFLCSDACMVADTAATAIAGARQEEQELLDAVCEALGAKSVIRLCSSYESERVALAAQRLLAAAPSIKAAINLSAVSLAIDDCYEVWESGFVSIPHDFVVSDLKPQLQALLMPGGGGSIGQAGGSSSRPSPTATAAMPLQGIRTCIYHHHHKQQRFIRLPSMRRSGLSSSFVSRMRLCV